MDKEFWVHNAFLSVLGKYMPLPSVLQVSGEKSAVFEWVMHCFSLALAAFRSLSLSFIFIGLIMRYLIMNSLVYSGIH